MTVETALRVAVLQNVDLWRMAFALAGGRPLTETPDSLRKQALDVLATAVERLQADLENAVWNLAGCDTFAHGYGLDETYAESLARPALVAVHDLAVRHRAAEAKVTALEAEIELSKRDPAHENCRNVEAQLERQRDVERAEVERLQAIVGDVWDAAFEASADGEGAKAEGASLGDGVRAIVRALRECRADLARVTVERDAAREEARAREESAFRAGSVSADEWRRIAEWRKRGKDGAR